MIASISKDIPTTGKFSWTVLPEAMVELGQLLEELT
jgi:hypothetical protein